MYKDMEVNVRPLCPRGRDGYSFHTRFDGLQNKSGFGREE
jgi:hypothetical protein